MAITFITPVEISPASTGWQDANVSAYVPAGTTGVVLHFDNTGASSYAIGFRKNGSTDTVTSNLSATCHTWAAIGVDASRILELSIANTTYIHVYLVGYFGSEAVFFDNAVDKSLGSISSWLDIDISAATGADTAIAAIFKLKGQTGITQYNLRCNGSTDNRLNSGYNHNIAGFIVGVDGSEICEGYTSNVSNLFLLVGYIKSGVTMLVNATDLSLGSTAAWTDLAALPSGATGGFIEVSGSSSTSYAFGLRENGSAEDIYQSAVRSSFAAVKADASRLIEGEIADTAIDFWLLGYPTAAGGFTPKARRGFSPRAGARF